jgi:glycerol transport system substrate-binding protein
MRRQFLTSTTALVLLWALAGQAYAGMDEAKTFLDKEIKDVSTLDRGAQEAEMQWFIDAAKPFAGMDIKVVFRDHRRRMNMNPRFWRPPSPRSPASRSHMT